MLIALVFATLTRLEPSFMHESKFILVFVYHHLVLLFVISGLATLAKLELFALTPKNRILLQVSLLCYLALSSVLIMVLPKVLFVVTTPDLGRLAQLKRNVKNVCFVVAVVIVASQSAGRLS